MLTIRGRNILDEGFGGSNVLDSSNKNRFTKEGALSLSQGIRSAVAGGNISTNDIGRKNIALAASTIAENLGKHTEDVQRLLDNQGDGLKAELAKLVKMMAEAQKLQGEKSTKAIKEIVTQVKLIQAAPGGSQLSESLGLDRASKDLFKNQTLRGKLQESLNVDVGAGFFGTIKQAFEPSRMFQGGSFLGLGGARFARLNAERQARSRLGTVQSTGALENVMNQLGLTSSETTLGRVPSTGPGVTPRFESGLDELGEPGKQTFLLEEILKELKKINEQGSGDGLGLEFLRPGSKLLSRLVTMSIPLVVAGITAYGVKELFDATERGAEERFEDDIIPGRPNVQYNTAKRQLVAALGRAPTEQEIEDFIAGKTIKISETSTPPLTPLPEDQGQVLTRRPNVQYNAAKRQLVTALGRAPTEQEIQDFISGKTKTASETSDITPLTPLPEDQGRVLTIGESTTTPIEGEAQGSLIQPRITIPVIDPNSGKTVEVYSEKQAQRVRDGEFDVESGKFIDTLANPPGYDPNVLDSSRLPEGYTSTPVSNLQSSILRTSDAVENMSVIAPATGTVVNNIVNNVASNQGGSRKFEQPSIAVSADTVRNSNNVVAEANRRSYIA